MIYQFLRKVELPEQPEEPHPLLFLFPDCVSDQVLGDDGIKKIEWDHSRYGAFENSEMWELGVVFSLIPLSQSWEGADAECSVLDAVLPSITCCLLSPRKSLLSWSSQAERGPMSLQNGGSGDCSAAPCSQPPQPTCLLNELIAGPQQWLMIFLQVV